MQAIELQETFGLENLHLAHREPPEPGPGQVLLRMRAASINYRDLLMLQGRYNPRQPLPLIPCSDGVGIVERLGPGVDRFKPGDRLCPIFSQAWLAGSPGPEAWRTTLGGPLDGTLAESMVLSAEGCVAAPAHLTDLEAAALPCAGVTAWTALIGLGRLRPGAWVLVQGSGGVSLFALQFARLAGARVVAVSTTPAKLERLEALGAEKVIDGRKEPGWGKVVRKATGGVDHVVEVGGESTLAESLLAARPGATLSLIGVLTGSRPALDLLPVLMHRLRLQGVFVGSRQDFEAMNRALEGARLRPVLDRSYPLEEAAEAFRRMAGGEHFGKICIAIP